MALKPQPLESGVRVDASFEELESILNLTVQDGQPVSRPPLLRDDEGLLVRAAKVVSDSKGADWSRATGPRNTHRHMILVTIRRYTLAQSDLMDS